MLANINYKCRLDRDVLSNMNFPIGKPAQIIDRCSKCTIVMFRSGKCRIMGCKKPVKLEKLPYNIKDLKLQSITITADLKQTINLLQLKLLLSDECAYEPELFPALRYIKYNPKCVNIFSTGKVVILGIQTLLYHNIINLIVDDIKSKCLQLKCKENAK